MGTAYMTHDDHGVQRHDPRSILVVDDESESRLILGEMLGHLGYQVIEHPDGSSALATIREGSRVDLIITDERMPDMSGIELAATVRRERPNVPIIMVTAHGGVENYLRSIGLGVFEYINKPMEKKELAVIVKAALRSTNPGNQ